MINKVILIGNLGRDPEIRHLESGASVATFSIATNENYRDKAGEWQTITQWHNIVAWRHLAEQAERRLKKGSMVFIEGKLTTRQYQDKDNNTRYVTEVVANLMRPLDRAPADGSSYGGAPMPTESPMSGSSNNSATSGPSGPAKKLEEFDEDDLPF